jgi:putative transposase
MGVRSSFRVRTQNGRCKKIFLLTTLLDPLLWPVELLAAIYGRRWDVELFLRDIKTTLQMEMLSCKSPAMVHKELEMHLIAYMTRPRRELKAARKDSLTNPAL